MPDANGYTPIETRMLKILGDGKPHTKDEMHGCVYFGDVGAMFVALHHLRKKIRPKGMYIVYTASEGYRLFTSDPIPTSG